MMASILRMGTVVVALVAVATAPVFAQQSRSSDRDSQDQGVDRRDPQSSQRYEQDRSQDRYDDQQYRDSQSRELQNDNRASRFRDAGDQQDDFRNQSGSDRNQSMGDQPGGLGVTVTEDDQQRVRVRRVFEGSPADEAGVQVGDELLTVDGQQVRSPQQLVSLIRQKDPNSRVSLRIRRDGQTTNLTTRLASRREALDIESSQFTGAGFDSRDFNTPRNSDLADHIQMLEQEIRRLSAEIADLRQMMSDEPTAMRSSGRTSGSGGDAARMNRAFRDDQGTQFDSQNRSQQDRFQEDQYQENQRQNQRSSTQNQPSDTRDRQYQDQNQNRD